MPALTTTTIAQPASTHAFHSSAPMMIPKTEEAGPLYGNPELGHVDISDELEIIDLTQLQWPMCLTSDLPPLSRRPHRHEDVSVVQKRPLSVEGHKRELQQEQEQEHPNKKQCMDDGPPSDIPQSQSQSQSQLPPPLVPVYHQYLSPMMIPSWPANPAQVTPLKPVSTHTLSLPSPSSAVSLPPAWPPPKRQLSLAHVPIIYETRGDKLYCLMCMYVPSSQIPLLTSCRIPYSY